VNQMSVEIAAGEKNFGKEHQELSTK